MTPRRQFCLLAAALWLLGARAAEAAASNEWWSLRPLVRPAVPRAETAAHPIDAFIAQKLQGMRSSPEADRRTLIRRLSFDLTGLPPLPERARRFVEDPDPKAYENLADELLASPQYGERWARHWLDVVHYGDTHGYDKDQPRPNAWPYRDYVIRSLNADKPYSRFIQEQLAGDALFPGTAEGIEALGFISAGPWDLIGHAEVPETKIDGRIARHLDRDDMVANTMSTFNSMTVHCAQCHDHKFDPITSEDYYSLQAVFAAVDRTNAEYYQEPELNLQRAARKSRERALTEKKKALDETIKEQGGPELAALQGQISALKKPQNEPSASKSQTNQAGLAELEIKLAALLERKIEAPVFAALREMTNTLAAVQTDLAAMPKPQIAFIGAVHHGSGAFRGTGPDGGKPRAVSILPRGDVRKPGKPAAPGALSAITALPARFASAPAEADRRQALALWLTDARNPLTWRSIVNRVWHYHFGRGIADTPNDFGRMGAAPTHPELLDWLAADFRDGRQSLKELHKLIVTSAAYRQISTITRQTAPNNELDRDNRFLWRMNSRRMEAEAIRDSVLFVSGKLDAKMFGPAFQDFIVEKPEHSPHYQYHLHDPEDPKSHRRSIYRFIVRSQQQPFMTTLDCADPSMLVDKRNESLSALQALALLNNGFMVTMARHFANRVEQAGGPIEEQVQRAFALALSRPPSATEAAGLAAFTEQHGLANACRLIFNLNEFTFLD